MLIYVFVSTTFFFLIYIFFGLFQLYFTETKKTLGHRGKDSAFVHGAVALQTELNNTPQQLVLKLNGSRSTSEYKTGNQIHPTHGPVALQQLQTHLSQVVPVPGVEG